MLVEHNVIEPSVPAFGMACKKTVTVLLAPAQGSGTLMVYVYTPAASMVGSNVPLFEAPPGAVQTPPISGVPPSCAKRSVTFAVSQSSIAPLIPASGSVVTTTSTIALAAGHGADPLTV